MNMSKLGKLARRFKKEIKPSSANGSGMREVTVVTPGDLVGQLGTSGVRVTASEVTEFVIVGREMGRFGRVINEGKRVEMRVANMLVQIPGDGQPITFLELSGRAPADGLGRQQVSARLKGTVFSGQIGGSADLNVIRVPVK